MKIFKRVGSGWHTMRDGGRVRRRARYAWTIGLVGLLALTACSPTTSVDTGSRLLVDSPLTPETPTLIVSLLTDQDDDPPPTIISERFPLIEVTQPADFVMITPTLPPSKTPITPAPSASLTPDTTETAPPPSLTQPPVSEFPTVGFTLSVTSVAVICPVAWAFSAPPSGCPVGAAVTSVAVYQSFEKNGSASYMLWTPPDTIYVLYGDNQSPHWRTFRDTYVEGQDPAYEPGLDYPPEFAPERPSMRHWQPRRGFGKVWRDNVTPLDIRERIGWADIEWEVPYTMVMQRGQDGLLYVTDPYGRIFGLPANGGRWTQTGYPQIPVIINPDPIATLPPGLIPLPPAP